MRILLSCLQSTRQYRLPAYQYWETYFRGGIAEGGHECETVPGVDWAEGLTYEHAPSEAAAWRARTWQRTVDSIAALDPAARPNVFLSYLYPWMVDEGAIREIRGLGVPCVNYFCDNVRAFTSAPSEYRPFDLHWVPELAATRLYHRAGYPFIHAAMPTWVPPRQRTWAHPERYGVTFIGSRDALREALFADAIGLGAPIELRGNGWPAGGKPPEPFPDPLGMRTGLLATIQNQWRDLREYGPVGYSRKISGRFRRPVDDALLAANVRPKPDAEQYVELTQQSMIVLGVNRYPSYRFPFDRPDTYSRGRDIEAPMMGACYLTEWTGELETMYEVGTEIETFRDAQEMVEKIRMLQAKPELRREMRRTAQRRALTEHSIPRTIERIAERLGIAEAPTVA